MLGYEAESEVVGWPFQGMLYKRKKDEENWYFFLCTSGCNISTYIVSLNQNIEEQKFDVLILQLNN